MSKRRSLPAHLGLVAVMAAGIAASGAAIAQEGKLFKDLMGNMGILPREKDAIPYRERAPLVVPPKSELRTPSASAAAGNPQWPNDPDVAAKRRAAEDARRPVTWSETRRMSDNNPRLSPEELRQGRIVGGPGPAPGTHRGDNPRDLLMANPDRIGAKKSGEDSKVAEAEPSRRVLTDPPTGMRRSAAGGAIKSDFAPRAADQQAVDASPLGWIQRKLSGAEDD